MQSGDHLTVDNEEQERVRAAVLDREHAAHIADLDDPELVDVPGERPTASAGSAGNLRGAPQPRRPAPRLDVALDPPRCADGADLPRPCHGCVPVRGSRVCGPSAAYARAPRRSRRTAVRTRRAGHRRAARPVTTGPRRSSARSRPCRRFRPGTPDRPEVATRRSCRRPAVDSTAPRAAGRASVADRGRSGSPPS